MFLSLAVSYSFHFYTYACNSFLAQIPVLIASSLDPDQTPCSAVSVLGLCCYRYEPPHDNTNKMAFAPSEDSDQPGHLPSLIRVFAVHMKKA